MNYNRPLGMQVKNVTASGIAAKRNSLALGGLRIAVGCLFLIVAQGKILGTEFTLRGGFQRWISRFLQDSATHPFIIPVVEGFVLLHAPAVRETYTSQP